MAVDLPKMRLILRKATMFNSQPTEASFPELPEVLIWFRFLLATLYGAMLGWSSSMRSTVMVLHTVNLVAFVPIMYCRMYLCIAEDTFPVKVIFSGLFPAVAWALLLWIYGFTLANEEPHIEHLSRLLVNGSVELEADASMNSESIGVEEEF